jgi:hypothetical protein
MNILKMDATYSSETCVGFQRTTRRYIPEDITPRVLQEYVRRLLAWLACSSVVVKETGTDRKQHCFEIREGGMTR